MARGLMRSIAAGLLAAAPAMAEDAAPAFTNLRYDENWATYDPAAGGTWMAPIKHIDLSDSVWLSLGGDLRLRWEYFDGANFDNANEDSYLLYRTYLHADLHLGPHWRVFLQGRFSEVDKRELPGGNREALDYDRVDLWNTFIEASYPVGDLRLTARLGRLELQYGKQRLISPLDWVNNRRIFDGVQTQLAAADGRWKLDAFVTQPVVIDGDSLTWNDTDDDRVFAGLYYTVKLGEAGKHGLDAYLLYQQRDALALVREDLYTLGARAFGPVYGNLSYDVEAAWQFGEREVSGRFFDNTLDINAWFASAEFKYTFAEAWGKPYLALGLDYASGDGDPTDDDVETFNQLYPLGHAYFGYIDTVALQNVKAVKLGSGIALVPNKLTAAADYHWLWRAHEGDGLYNAGGAPVRGAQFVTPGGRTVTAQESELGQELDLTLNYTPNRHLAFALGYSRFWAGDFLQETGVADDTDFVYLQAEVTF
ncbi:MAG: hypothetical protein RLZZ303_2699 [Candidatus Hydrogenedentota bacterium]